MCVGAGSLQHHRSSGIRHRNPAGPQRVAGGVTAQLLAPCCCDEPPRSCCSGRAPKTLSSCRSIRAWGLTYRLCLQHTLEGDKTSIIIIWKPKTISICLVEYLSILFISECGGISRWSGELSEVIVKWGKAFNFNINLGFILHLFPWLKSWDCGYSYLRSVSTRIFSNRLRISDIYKDLLLLYAESNKLRWSKHLNRMELSF